MEIETVVLDDNKKDLTIDGTLSLAESFRLEDILKKYVYRFGLIGKQTNFFENRKNFRTAIQYIVGADAEVEYTALGTDKMKFHLEYGESPKAEKLFKAITEEFKHFPVSGFKTEEEYYSRDKPQ